VGRLTNCSDAFENSISRWDLHPAQPQPTQKNEIGKRGLFYLVYLAGFNSEGLNLAQKGCVETRALCFRNCILTAEYFKLRIEFPTIGNSRPSIYLYLHTLNILNLNESGLNFWTKIWIKVYIHWCRVQVAQVSVICVKPCHCIVGLKSWIRRLR